MDAGLRLSEGPAGRGRRVVTLRALRSASAGVRRVRSDPPSVYKP